MRRLTLILSDLYLPADVARESFPTTLELPGFSWLLRFADSATRITDWRSWLARKIGVQALADAPIAHVCARAVALEPAGCWLATPVRLEARLDHVRLADRGMLRLSREQSAGLAEEFRASFGPETLVAFDNERALLLQGGPVVDVRTHDPARLLDTDVGSSLPAIAGGGGLRRLKAEIEMWLPGTRTNALRARAGQPKITALWLWGGGAVAASEPLHAGAAVATVRLMGGDAFLFALARLGAKRPLQPAPAGFEDLGDDDTETCVELAPMSGAANEDLQSVENDWLEPARAALAQGRLEMLQVVANDRVHAIRPRSGWKFWRRRRGWLESLA